MTLPCETPRNGPAALFAIALQGHLPTLSTDRLLLRAPRVTDFDTYAQIACSGRGEHIGGPMSREDAWTDFSQMTSTWLLHGHGLWTIGHAGDISGFVLLGFEAGDQEPELGFMLTEKAEGMGIGFEAAQAALTHAFDTLGWSTLVSYIDPANARSIKLAQRLGGLPDGEITEDGETTLIYRYVREVM
ncbi:GNAT family N-acetyltransferase [uncultured Tateyamaria sp.]|uniref:GNAT family N-acetyltransferase n=1 Tax=uncultured Tateyamaria sp. TaxID=455651 RepID=UPI00262D5D65|nr:GNAT family N-acetyltransferase [uncultured Tateyamaria sp.]